MIARVFFDVDMRMGPDGLRELLKAKRVAITQMKDADFVMFLNKRKTHFKMLNPEGYLLMFKGERRLELSDIEKIPSLFGGSKPLIKGQNLEKVQELLGKEMKVFEEGNLKYIS